MNRSPMDMDSSEVNVIGVIGVSGEEDDHAGKAKEKIE